MHPTGVPATIPLPPRGGPQDISSPRDGGTPVDHLQDAIDALHAYLKVEGDPEDKAVATELLAKAQKLIAKDQLDLDKGLGAGPGVALVRKQQQRATISSGGGY